MTTDGRELEWEEQIENDGPDFEVLPAGDYDFEVLSFERARFAGSDKMPPCRQAIISIKITGAAGQTTVKHNLFLHTKTEGLLCAFFTGIGHRKHGERITMNWNKVVGSRGRCKVGTRTFKGKNGDDITVNEIKKFYEPKVDTGAQPAQFTPGNF